MILSLRNVPALALNSQARLLPVRAVLTRVSVLQQVGWDHRGATASIGLVLHFIHIGIIGNTNYND